MTQARKMAVALMLVEAAAQSRGEVAWASGGLAAVCLSANLAFVWWQRPFADPRSRRAGSSGLILRSAWLTDFVRSTHSIEVYQLVAGLGLLAATLSASWAFEGSGEADEKAAGTMNDVSTFNSHLPLQRQRRHRHRHRPRPHRPHRPPRHRCRHLLRIRDLCQRPRLT